MNKFLLLLLCALLVLADPLASRAESAETGSLTEMVSYPRVPRPVYKRYRGNSRGRKVRPSFLKRAALRRKAKQKQAANASRLRSKAPQRRGVIQVEAPVGTMPKPAQK